MNADVSIPVDYITTVFEIDRRQVCPHDFIRQNTKSKCRIFVTYRLKKTCLQLYRAKIVQI